MGREVTAGTSCLNQSEQQANSHHDVVSAFMCYSRYHRIHHGVGTVLTPTPQALLADCVASHFGEYGLKKDTGKHIALFVANVTAAPRRVLCTLCGRSWRGSEH
jgi:hypothetical protein